MAREKFIQQVRSKLGWQMFSSIFCIVQRGQKNLRCIHVLRCRLDCAPGGQLHRPSPSKRFRGALEQFFFWRFDRSESSVERQVIHQFQSAAQEEGKAEQDGVGQSETAASPASVNKNSKPICRSVSPTCARYRARMRDRKP